jgi:glycosyltransferase involved in cell wall biosynthesis
MKVLHIINSLAMGGAERLISDLLPSLARRGVECVLLALDERDDAFSGSLGAAGITVRFSRSGGSNLYSPVRLFDILRTIEEEKPDIVHAHLGPTFHWCAIASLILLGRGWVTTEHASSNRRMNLHYARGIERFLYSRYGKVITVSEDAARSLMSWVRLDPAKVVVIPNGIHKGRIAEGRASPAPDVVSFLQGRIGIAMTARLVPEKDHATALMALSLLPAEYCLVFAGDGNERLRLQQRARELMVADRCMFLGTRSDIPAVLAASRVYLQSSRIEGFGIAVLEAMAAGLPVVASDAPGIGNLVRGAGLLFPPGDAKSCAVALRRLVDERELATDISLKGAIRAGEYSMERCASAYEAVYRETISR